MIGLPVSSIEHGAPYFALQDIEPETKMTWSQHIDRAKSRDKPDYFLVLAPKQLGKGEESVNRFFFDGADYTRRFGRYQDKSHAMITYFAIKLWNLSPNGERVDIDPKNYCLTPVKDLYGKRLESSKFFESEYLDACASVAGAEAEMRFAISMYKDVLGAPVQRRSDMCRWVKLAADHKIPIAQRIFGLVLRHKLGCENNDEAAVMFFEAAAQGDKQAMEVLDQYVKHGIGAAGLARQFKIYSDAGAMNQWDSRTKNFYGFALRHGIGCPQDVRRGVEYIWHAACEGNASAQYNLAFYMHHGIEFEHNAVNKAEALLLAQESAAQHHEAGKRFSRYLQSQEHVAKS